MNRCKDYCTVKKLGYKFLYLDESGADENLYPSAGYIKINESYIVTTAAKSERISCLLCMSDKKAIGH